MSTYNEARVNDYFLVFEQLDNKLSTLTTNDYFKSDYEIYRYRHFNYCLEEVSQSDPNAVTAVLNKIKKQYRSENDFINIQRKFNHYNRWTIKKI